MRILGGIIFLMGTMGFGIYQAVSYEEAIAMLKQAADMLRYLIAQIQTENASLPESICKVSSRMDGVIGKILQDIQKRNNQNDGKPLYQIWQEEMMQLNGYLPAGELDLLVHLFDQTGFYDTKAQLQRLQLNLESMTEEIRLREEQKEKRCRLYQSLGLMVGIFVIILLW